VASLDKDFILPDNLIIDNPTFIDTSQEFEDDCGDACKI
jgi:hypothetical protein